MASSCLVSVVDVFGEAEEGIMVECLGSLYVGHVAMYCLLVSIDFSVSDAVMLWVVHEGSMVVKLSH